MRFKPILFILVIQSILFCQESKNSLVTIDNLHSGPILFISFYIIKPHGTSIRHLFSMNEDGTGIKQLTNDSDSHVFNASWSPNSKQIAYASSQGLFIMNANASEKKLLAKSGDNPRWSPNGKQIAFTKRWGFEGSGAIIYLVNSDRTNEQPLHERDEDNRENVRLNDWSPDGKTIIGDGEIEKAYVNGRMQANNRIVFYDLKGNILKTYGEIGLTLQRSVYSVSGKKIAFISGKNRNSGINILELNGNNETLISPSNKLENRQYTNFYYPVSWSPNDSSVLCNIGPQTSVFNRIVLINVYTRLITDITPITDDSTFCFAADWRKR